MTQNINGIGTLKLGEPHPAAYDAMAWIRSLEPKTLLILEDSFQSCAIEDNREAEICGETLRRVLMREPVSDRYVLGLAWYMRHIMNIDSAQ
jgi:hypothetical protein